MAKALKSLVLGGARSGKSRYAQQLAECAGRPVTFVATARAEDEEMAARIQKHQLERPANWRTIEAPIQLGAAISQYSNNADILIVDCLTLWLSNLLCHSDKELLRVEMSALSESVLDAKGELIFVSNEVGLGVVPMTELSRRFVDEAGFLHQELAKICDRVVFCIAGIPQLIKGG